MTTPPRRVLVLDSMGRTLGLAMSCVCAEPFQSRPRFPVERIDARSRPDWDSLLREIREGAVAGVIYTGSKAGVYEREPWIADLLAFTRELVALEPRRPTPVLGICFGHQLLAEATAGPGAVEKRPPLRRGVVEVEITGDAPIFDGLPRPRFRAIVTHQDHVLRVAPDFEVVARADYTPIHAVRHRARPIFGVQFHPEHRRPVMNVDEREYGHANWRGLDDAEIATAQAPRVLESFAKVVDQLAAGG
jgi:GMP synthase (glutamine-hydrolysing)